MADERHTDRSGPLWDFLAGRSEPPPVTVLLGFALRAVDPDAGTVEIGFTAPRAFTNPVGDVPGGMLSAMLDDTLGPALSATLGPDDWAPTTDLHVQFLAPARPGTFTGHGRVVRAGSRVAFLAGELLQDSTGEVVATATATCSIRRAR